MEKHKIEELITRITQFRNNKGITYKSIANKLLITTSAYWKIENGKTTLTVERLFQISEILEVSLSELLENGNDVFQQTNNERIADYQQKIENFYQESKEVYEKLLQSKEEQIALLKSTVKV